jgi:hypothetical protein
VCVRACVKATLCDLRRFAAVNLFRTEWSNVTKHRILYKFILWGRLLNKVIFLHSRLIPRQRMISDENQTPRILQTKKKQNSRYLIDIDKRRGTGAMEENYRALVL